MSLGAAINWEEKTVTGIVTNQMMRMYKKKRFCLQIVKTIFMRLGRSSTGVYELRYGVMID